MPQLPTDGTFAFFVATLAAFLSVLLLFFWLRLMQELRLRRRVQRFELALQNTGNIATPYELRLSETSQELAFSLLTAAAPLPEQTRTAPRGRTGPVAPRAPGASPMGALREVSMMGSSLASILPAPIAKPIQAMTSGIMKAVSTTMQVQRVQKTGDKLAKQGQKLAGAAGAAGGKPTVGGATQTVTAPAVEVDIVDRWYETPALNPGQHVALILEINWRTATPATPYPFRLISQPGGATVAGAIGAVPVNSPDLLITDSPFATPTEGWGWRILPTLIRAAMLIAALLLIAVIISVVLMVF